MDDDKELFRVEGLAEIGVPVMKAQAGIFVMADFSSYLKKQEFQEEHVLWEDLSRPDDQCIAGAVIWTQRPGWFRACYAFDKDTVEEVCRRLKTLQK